MLSIVILMMLAAVMVVSFNVQTPGLIEGADRFKSLARYTSAQAAIESCQWRIVCGDTIYSERVGEGKLWSKDPADQVNALVGSDNKTIINFYPDGSCDESYVILFSKDQTNTNKLGLHISKFGFVHNADVAQLQERLGPNEDDEGGSPSVSANLNEYQE